jgi:hypothetical protein
VNEHFHLDYLGYGYFHDWSWSAGYVDINWDIWKENAARKPRFKLSHYPIFSPFDKKLRIVFKYVIQKTYSVKREEL